MQEGKENACVFLFGGSAEHRDSGLVHGVCRARHRVLVSAPNRSAIFLHYIYVVSADGQVHFTKLNNLNN